MTEISITNKAHVVVPRSRIIFVDDEIGVLDGIKRAMRSYEDQWEMYFFDNPQHAIDFQLKNNAQIVVTDINMPIINGMKLVSAMEVFSNKTKFIILTGSKDINLAIEAVNSKQIYRFFIKPCSNSILVEGIKAALVTLSEEIQTKTISALGEAALEVMPVAVLVVDGDCHLVFINRLGGALCSSQDGLIVGPTGTCRVTKSSESRHLQSLVKSVALSGEPAGMSVTRKDGAPLSMVITRLDDEGVSSPRVALYITDPDARRLPSVRQLSIFLGITLSEARLAHSLALGLSVEEAALPAGITVSTARTYLKQIFAKTGKSRQADLVRLIMTLPLQPDGGKLDN